MLNSIREFQVQIVADFSHILESLLDIILIPLVQVVVEAAEIRLFIQICLDLISNLLILLIIKPLDIVHKSLVGIFLRLRFEIRIEDIPPLIDAIHHQFDPKTDSIILRVLLIIDHIESGIDAHL